ncbi:helicase-primase helicase subunit [Macropodid alphaherpesvirus 2]|uniref:Helicase-primase helicase subunit n=1 Tax=Macropodid alphaherpesvirus 2 TaxID=83440 RepID=A0AAE7SXT2_9ALPH|nr:helicase-primase helicase subunit [Macropodid alphaherpesvirus 2]QOD40195.1 helicase-primase helicase subunit [Macropodid alphaherpesvirus 2]WGO49758.1 helicase-primase helicase subunit [Macropodid alphaherpesvirus 2]
MSCGGAADEAGAPQKLSETNGDISQFNNHTFLNFTSMHEIQPIVERVQQLAEHQLDPQRIPQLKWFRDVADASTPAQLPLREFPFAGYLISGNAGSGKSTCIQTLNEALNCVVTGATRVASQNMYMKLSGAFLSRPINTIFHEFGFKGNHVQAQLGQHPYVLSSNPATLEDLQRRDLTYYWEVLVDITRRVLGEGENSHNEFRALEMLERDLGLEEGSLTQMARFTHASLPSFTGSNIIIIDEAGLLGRHILTAVVYCWWMVNALYKTPLYTARLRPVIVCVGSPTQTESLESTFVHQTLRCSIKQSENVLTYLICNRTLRDYTQLSQNWAIFINNKRCVEYEFGNLMKVLEYGLPITEEHMQFVDRFVVPESYINNPANLPGWTRLFSSHKEVSSYMARLHNHLKVTQEAQFVVFTLPSLTFVSMQEFEKYKQLTHQPYLSIEKWITANASRITNYSQSQDQDAGRMRQTVNSKQQTVIVKNDITYVLNSQVAVTTRLRKMVFGFTGTFKLFEAMLRDDSFVKTQGELLIEFAYQFLSKLIFGGLIHFYDFLAQPERDAKKCALAYQRLGELTAELLSLKQTKPQPSTPNISGSPERTLNFTGLGDPATDPLGEPDVIFANMVEEIDWFYCHYDLTHPETTAAVHMQFSLLKRAFLGRYVILQELFGEAFEMAPFSSYIDNVIFRGCEMVTGSLGGGFMSVALQTDNYTLMGYTHARVHPFTEDLRRRHGKSNISELLEESPMPYVVLLDQHGFVSVINTNISDFVESVDTQELAMAINADYGMSSKLAMTITRSQGLSLDKVAICFSPSTLRLNSAYVAMSRTTSSDFLCMNLNPLRARYERDDIISEHILSALRDPNVLIVY